MEEEEKRRPSEYYSEIGTTGSFGIVGSACSAEEKQRNIKQKKFRKKNNAQRNGKRKILKKKKKNIKNYTIGIHEEYAEKLHKELLKNNIKISGVIDNPWMVCRFIVFSFATKEDYLKAFQLRYEIDNSYGTYREYLINEKKDKEFFK